MGGRGLGGAPREGGDSGVPTGLGGAPGGGGVGIQGAHPGGAQGACAQKFLVRSWQIVRFFFLHYFIPQKLCENYALIQLFDFLL